MKPKEIFKLAVRLLGLWFVYLGLTNVPMVFQFGWGNEAMGLATIRAVVFVVFYFGCAWWLLGGASFLVNRAYPDANREPQAESRTSAASAVTQEA